MTNFDYITNMTLDELAEKAVKECKTATIYVWMSLFTTAVFGTKKAAIEHNKRFLNMENKIGRESVIGCPIKQ
ncbi:MAG: hypothetical protein IJA34_00430 [Lachnospiraceae bacterium]|nr:hypothetical protein [Lachnospiraceae bacterium]